MAEPNAYQGLMPSIVDRLIDADSGGTAARRGYSVDQMVVAVRRDLEELLNTRESFPRFPSKLYPELSHSILTYGLRDLTFVEMTGSKGRRMISSQIEEVIARNEPRLKNIRVRIVDELSDAKRLVRFHIDAQLRVDPAPEVGFETTLELTTGHATVKSSK